MTKKEAIIHYFEKMDVRMLEVLLDDSKTYQNTPKEFFLEKLELAFNEFRSLQDTCLNSYKGVCSSKICPNKGCRGFSFVGNVSGRRIDLIFEDTGADYVDIYECHEMESESTQKEKSFPICLDIKHDEQTDFDMGVDFLIQSQKCKNAYDELKEIAEGKIVDEEIYLNWLEKHRALFDAFDLPPFFFRNLDNFYNLFYGIDHLAAFIRYNELASIAYTEYQNSPPVDEGQLLQWLCRHEKLGNLLMLFPYPDNLSAKEIEKGYFIFDGIRLNRAEYENIIRFKKIFNRFYWEMLDKYRTPREVKANDLSEVVSITGTDDPLSFHLRKIKGKIH